MRRVLLVVLMLASVPAAARDRPRPAASQSSVRAVTSTDVALQRAALEDLNDADPATIPVSVVPALVELAKRGPTEVREEAIQLIGHIGPRAYSKGLQRLLVSYLDLRAKAPPGRIRGWAAWALGKVGAPVKEVGLSLLAVTGPYDDFARAAAMEGFLELSGDVPGFLRIAMAASEKGYLRATMLRLLVAIPESDGGLSAEEAGRYLEQAHRTEREPLLVAIARETPATDAGAARLAKLLAATNDYFGRRILLARLEQLGPVAAPAAPVLCELLSDPDASIFAVSDALQAIGPSPETSCAIPPLQERFPTERAYTVATTAAHLGQPGLALLIWGLKHHDPEVRSSSLIAISDMSPPPALAFSDVRRLTMDPRAARTAIDTFAGYGDRAHPHLVRLFRTAPPKARAAVAPHLGAEDWDLLFAAVEDSDEEVRGAVLRRLSELGLHAEKVVPHLVRGQRFHHPTPKLVEPFGVDGARVLIELTRSNDAKVRETAVYTLAAIRHLPEESVRALELALDDEAEDVRMWAANSLGHYGAAANEATPSLLSALLDPSYRVREYAARSLGEVGGVSAESDLIDLVCSPGVETLVRVGAIEGLAALGTPNARTAVLQAATDEDDYLRGRAIRMLGEFEPTEATLAALRKALDDEDRDVRVAAAYSLLDVGRGDDRLRANAVIDSDGPFGFVRPDL